MITVDLGDGVIHEVDESTLDGPFLSSQENDNEKVDAVEYHLAGRVVHRSVHVTLKQGIGIEGVLGQIGG